MSERYEPVPVPAGDGRHDIGDEVRAAIVNRLIADWSRDPDLSAEKVRQLAMWAGASVRALLHELGTLKDSLVAPPSAVRAAPLASSSGQGWQPIETAPKDGTQLLLWIVGIEPRPRIAFWSERGSDSGWYGLQTQHFIGVNVTHWMPLPPAPSPASDPTEA